EGRCSYSCKNVCDAAETCDGTNCVLVGPRVTQVNAPTAWSPPSQNVTVTAVVDDTPKTGTTSPGIASAALRSAGKQDIAATITDSGSGVDPATLQLIEGANRFDHGTPTCGAGQTAQQQVCHFTVAKSYLGAGNQGRIQFAVAGRDKTGNAIAANSAALGID